MNLIEGKLTKKWSFSLILRYTIGWLLLFFVFGAKIIFQITLQLGWIPEIPEAILFDIVRILAAIIGIDLIIRVRKLRSVDAATLIEKDSRAPVLYLRSFKAEKPSLGAKILAWLYGIIYGTEEISLAKLMNNIGPFVAIGDPSEKLPELGAARMYVEDEQWQDKVKELINRSQLVVLNVGNTAGFWWEVDQVLQSLSPEKIVFVLPKKDKLLYRHLCDNIKNRLPKQLPKNIGKNRLLYFNSDWTPKLNKTKLHGIDRIGSSSVKRMYIEAFRPVFRNLNLTVPKLPFPTIIKGLIGLICFGFLMGYLTKVSQDQLDAAKHTIAKAQLGRIEEALRLFYLDNGRYPTMDEGLDILLENNKYGRNYIANPDIFIDPWRRKYYYESPGKNNQNSFDIFTYGKDGIAGGREENADVGNWD